ncbi:hypothetical protein ACLBVR_34375, partial [Pseudomonas aeruginosa]
MQELKQRLASPPAELTPAERKVVRANKRWSIRKSSWPNLK